MNDIIDGSYTPRIPSITRRVEIRGLGYNVREWGDPSAPLLVLVHGHRDASSTFQFIVDLFKKDWRVVSPDWRGFGHTDWAPHGYWYQDYVADLDALLEVLSPDAPVRLAGHSLGGNISNVYAGVRPERVARVCSLDGFGLRTGKAEDAPGHLEKFLAAWRQPTPTPRPYPDVTAMAERLMAANGKLDRPRALFLAAHQHRKLDDGSLVWSFDPAHSRPFATLHRVDEWGACWRRIEAPALWISSDRVFPPSMQKDSEYTFEWRLQQVRDVSFHRLAGTGHNVHHDAPELVADLIEEFMASSL